VASGSSTKLLSPENIDMRGVKLNEEYENAIVLRDLQNMTKYYVFLQSTREVSYRIRLTFGYDLDINNNHVISRMKIDERSQNSVQLQPGEIMFIEVRVVSEWTVITFAHSHILKLCSFRQTDPPQSHEDVLNNNKCANSRISKDFFIRKDFSQQVFDYFAVENEQAVSVDLSITTEN
jgi:hypothetical protein